MDSVVHMLAQRQRRNRLWLIGLGLLALALMGAYLFLNIYPGQWNYAFPRRLIKVGAVLLAGLGVGISSLLFQTITNNRILTPAIVGFDALYLLLQGVVIYSFSALGSHVMGDIPYFIINVVLMVIFAEVLFKFLFGREQSYLYFVLLAGVVCGVLFRSVFSFFTMLLDPNEFDLLQTKMYANFNSIPSDLIALSAVMILGVLAYGWRHRREFDVLLLGKENAHNLGIDTDGLQHRILRVISILVAVSTALVGPITFLGLLVVNIVYQLMHTYRHSYLMIGTIFISWIALFFGLLMVERVFDFTTNLTVIINGVGGTYFLYLLMKGGR